MCHHRSTSCLCRSNSTGGSMKLSRRSLVQNAGIVAGAGLLGVGTSATGQSQLSSSGRKPRALALIGDGYHGPDAYTAYEADLETPKTFPDPKPVTWIREEQGAAIKEFVTGGNGFYALHNCSHISLSSKDYREVMGGAYISHPPLRPFEVHATANKHPITEGMSAFSVNDEQHYVTYDKDPKYVILEAENIDGLKFENLGTKSISGWAYDYGKGRVVFTAVGHTIHAMWNPQYIEIQKRSIRWLLKDL